MDEHVLLTDDEIVALSAVDGRPWPLGLITVGTTAAELTQAGLRGIRSLAVRRLLTDVAGGQRRPIPLLADQIAAFISAEERIGAYIAPRANPDVLAGASVTAAHTSNGWLVDTATADGVHALRAVSADEAATAVIDFVDAAVAEAPPGLTCLLRYGQHGRNVVIISDPSEWNPAMVRDAVGASAIR